MKCLVVVMWICRLYVRMKMKCFDVVKEDMQEVGGREDEVFGCGVG